MLLKTIQESIIDIFYPLLCANCGCPIEKQNTPKHLCRNCFSLIKINLPPFCIRCGRSLQHSYLSLSTVCRECRNKKYFFCQAWSVCKYEGVIKKLIHMFKYQQRTELQGIFAKLIEGFLARYPDILRHTDYIIPIPLSPTKYREREFNQTQALAEIANRTLKKPVLLNTLYRIRNTRPQADLKEQQRRKNIEDCFQVKNPETINSKNILLIDDVLTTGTTVSEAAKIIKKHNAKEVLVFTLAS